MSKEDIATAVFETLASELTRLGLKKLSARISTPKGVAPGTHFSEKDIAIVVSIARPVRTTVDEFLYKNRIMAEIVQIEGKGRLSQKEEDWTAIVAEFYQIIWKIQSMLGAPTYHLFVAAPAALTFALGAVLGLNYDVHVYHWFGDDYKEVLVTSSKLLG